MSLGAHITRYFLDTKDYEFSGGMSVFQKS